MNSIRHSTETLFRPFTKWTLVAFIILITGCSQPTTETPITELVDEIQTVALTGQPTASQSSVVPDDAGSNPIDQSGTTIPDDEIELPEGVNFFAPQRATSLAVEVTGDQEKSLTVRLIGIVRSSETSDQDATALIKIETHLIPLKVGESSGEISLLSIDTAARSATIQHGRERLTLVMMDQPITNTTTNADRPRLFPQSPATGNRSHSASRRDEMTPPGIVVPEIEPLIEPFRDQSPIDLPDDLELPELPELPGLDDISL